MYWDGDTATYPLCLYMYTYKKKETKMLVDTEIKE